MTIGEVHAVCVLLSSDCVGEVLDLEISLEQFDVHEFALRGVPAIGTHQVKRKVSIMRFDKPLHQARIHDGRHCDVWMALTAIRTTP